VPVAVALLVRRGEVLVVQRPPEGPLAGQWEFPGGKVEFGETPEEALRRELREELGAEPEDLALFGVYSHVYELPDGPAHYLLLVYLARLEDNALRTLPSPRPVRWVDGEALRALPLVDGSRPVAADLLRRGDVREGGRP
jgi:8-oxo-dGTP diphosphatase